MADGVDVLVRDASLHVSKHLLGAVARSVEQDMYILDSRDCSCDRRHTPDYGGSSTQWRLRFWPL